MSLATLARATPKAGMNAIYYIRKYFYFIILIIVLIPPVIISIQIAIETNNPTFPIFDLATRILTADNSVNENIEILKEDPSKLVGMEKPTSGIWKSTVYYWSFFWKVIYRLLGDVWLIFFPLVIIYKLIKGRNISEPYKNMRRATWYFLLYLFITNTIIFIHGILVGNIFITLPEGIDNFRAYYLLFINILPFHGLVNLVIYLISLATN